MKKIRTLLETIDILLNNKDILQNFDYNFNKELSQKFNLNMITHFHIIINKVTIQLIPVKKIITNYNEITREFDKHKFTISFKNKNLRFISFFDMLNLFFKDEKEMEEFLEEFIIKYLI